MYLQVINRPLKITHSFEHTFDNKHVKITCAKKAFLFPVFEVTRDEQIGFLYAGPLGITGDLLVHSKEGAVGKIFEETYSSALFVPANLDFLRDHVKEITPIEEEKFLKYKKIISSFEVHLSSKSFCYHSNKDYFLLLSGKTFSICFINGDTTISITHKEIIGRTGERKLFWFSPKNIVFTNDKGDIFSTSNMFSNKNIIKMILKSLETNPVRDYFSNFDKLLSH